MRVLYCNKYNFEFSGTEVYLFDLMRLMKEQGHEVSLFSMAGGKPSRLPGSEYGTPHVDFKKQNQPLLRRLQLAAHAIYSRDARLYLRRLLRDFQPDVAHVRNIYHHLSPSILWELHDAKVPVIYHINDFKMFCPSYNFVAHNSVCERCRGGKFLGVVRSGCYQGGRAASVVLAAEAYLHHWLGTFEKCVDRFLAPSEFAREKLIEHGIAPGRISVLPHFQRVAEPLDPTPTDGVSVLYFGRLSPEKGVADLLLAMRRLTHIPLRIAGDGPQRKELERMAAASGMRNVTFLGHLSETELANEIAAARLTVFPSHAYETFGKTILESFAHARPVVATDLGSRRELVQDQETGLLYKPGDIEHLGEAISFLWGHRDRAAAMGRAGLRLVKQRHTPERHYQQLIDTYAALVSKKKAARPLRIAFIGGRGVVSRYSGIECYYEEVGSRLAALGHDLTVYCRTYFTPAVREYRGMKILRLPTRRSKHLETLLHTLLCTVHACWKRYDVLHYHALGPALFSWIPRLFGIKTVVTVQGLDWQRKKWGRMASAVLKYGEKAAATFPDRTMVVSQALARHYRDTHGIEADLVPNGTVLRSIRSGLNLSRWGLQPQGYVLFLGRFSPEKNCHLLVEAFERISTPKKLVFAGGSSYTDQYAAELRSHASDKILFLDWVSGAALDELLTNAALFVLPSDLEGLSLALLDAMGAGLCVLTSDIPENRELVEGAGFTFRPRDVEDLERILRILLAHPELRRQAGMSARQRIADSYLWPAITVKVEQVYLEMAGRASADIPMKKRSLREGKAAIAEDAA